MRKNILEQFQAAFSDTGPKPFTKGALTLRKAEGAWHLMGRFSNPYRDIDFHAAPLTGGHIVTDEAHKEFEAWLDKNPQHALELWSYHQWGTARTSRANWWAYTGNAFYMQWPLTEEEAKAISEWALDNEPGMSFGFYVFKSNWEEGLIEKYRAFEASILPLSRAANPWTSFQITSKEQNMKFSDEKRAMLLKFHDEAFVKSLEEQDDQMAAVLTAAGVERKEATVEAETVVINADQTTVEVSTKDVQYATPEEVVGALERVEKAFSGALETMNGTVAALVAKVQTLETALATVTNTQTETSKVMAAPLSVLTSYTPKSILAQEKSEETKKSPAEIDGRSALAKGPAPVTPVKSSKLGLWAQDIKGQ
jgi:hypothetical protein